MMAKMGINTGVSVSYLLNWRQSECFIPGVHLHHMCLPGGKTKRKMSNMSSNLTAAGWNH